VQQSSGNGFDDLRGQRLGAYEITELIGRGGMAVVYRARQPALGRDVALKVLPRYYLHQPEFRARFEREAHTAARLEHPHILPIYDYGQSDDMPYIAMRLVESGTLRAWLDQGIPLARALRMFRGILSALKYAHGCQPAVIHRDVNPKNILIGADDWPMLADFGIAKILDLSTAATGPGTMIGTPEYIAPEQSQGSPLDHRSDLYAMGVVLFEMLAGQPPFRGPTPLAVVLQQVGAEIPSVRMMKPDLPAVWDDVIRRSLAKNPDDRYPSAQAMDEAIQSAWEQTQRTRNTRHADTTAPATSIQDGLSRRVQRSCASLRSLWSRRRRQVLAWMILLALVAAAPIGSVMMWLQPVAVPDGLVPVRVYVAENGNDRVAVVNPVNNRVETTIPVGPRPGLLASDLGGARIYVPNNGGDAVSVIDTDKNAVVASVPVGASPFGVAVMPDGGRVYVGNAGTAEQPGSTVSVIDTRSLTVIDTIAVGSVPGGVTASRDGKRVYVANSESSSVSVIDTAINAVLATVPVGERPAGIAATLDDARVYVANARDDTVSVIDTARNTVIATVPVGAAPSGVAAQQDGKRVYIANEDAESVSVLDTASNSLIATVDVGPRPFDLVVSPDDSRVFVTTYGNRSVAVIDTTRLARLASVRVGSNPLGVVLKP
jgi:serine/threonine protein kinase, bacterial